MGILLKNILAVMPVDGSIAAVRKDIYIEGDKITSLDLEPLGFKAEKVIDGKRKLVIPGLINCHTHSYMSIFRNCADDLPFMKWLFDHILPLEDQMISDDAYWGASLACIEMIKSGTTCFSDMHMNINETAKAAVDIGMRAVLSRGLTGNSAEDEDGKRRIREAKQEIEEWKSQELLSFMLAPHAPYTCDSGYLRLVMEEASKLSVGLHIHLSESKDEINNMHRQCGRTPIEFVESLGLFAFPTLAAHCVQLTGHDIDLLKEHRVNVVTNPSSNMKLGNGFAPVPDMLFRGINVCLGTDGASSNNSLNLFKEMNLLSLIHKGSRQDAVSISSQDAIKIATENGAAALLLGDKTGRIEAGRNADLAILNLDVPQFMPMNNPVSALAYSANGSEVETVIIHGKIVMENRQMKTIDEEKVYFEVSKTAKRMGIYGKQILSK